MSAGKRMMTCLFVASALNGLAQTVESNIKSYTKLVTVPVVVTRDGKPVLDLSKDDFVIEQDKNRVEISGFELIRPDPEAAKDVRLSSSATSAPSQASEQDPTRLAANHYQSLTVIAVDALNTSYFRQKEGQRAIMDFLSEGLQTGQPTALVVLNRNGVKVVCDFSTDISALKHTAGQLKAELSGNKMVKDAVGNTTEADASDDHGFGPKINVTELPGGGQAGTTLHKILAAMVWEEFYEEKVAKFQQNENARITLRSFGALASALGKLPGRKALVWLSSSLPFPADYKRYPGTEIGDMYARVIQQLNDASVSIYSVHLKGLEVISPESDVSISRWQRGMGTNFEAWYDRPKALIDTARDISQKTGGIAFVNTNDFAKALRQSLDDSNTYYMLSYYLKSSQAKPGWHSLKVHAKQQDVTVRSRTGFLIPKAE